MEITLTIPDDIATELQNGGAAPLSRRLLEIIAIEGYKSGMLTEFQVQRILGFEDRFEVHGFLKEHGAYLDYGDEDLERDSAALDAFLDKQ
jgi:hypothetical protein